MLLFCYWELWLSHSPAELLESDVEVDSDDEPIVKKLKTAVGKQKSPKSKAQNKGTCFAHCRYAFVCTHLH